MTPAQEERLNSNPLASQEASDNVIHTSSGVAQLDTEVEEPEEADLETEAEAPADEEDKQETIDFDLNVAIQKQFGVSGEDLKAGIEFIKDLQYQQAQVAATNALSQQWNVPALEVSRRLGIIADEFNKLPENERAALDNIEGAIQIWNDIENRDGVKSARLTKTSGTSTKKKAQYDFTQQQIDAMTPEERQRRDKAIQIAYANGRVRGAI